MLKIIEKYPLNAQNIDVISSRIEEICQSLKLHSDQKIRVRLLIEEVLIGWQEKEDKEVEVEVRSYTRFLRPVISVSYPSSEAKNPLKAEEYEGFLKTAFEQLSFAPDYTYEKGRNVISIRLRKSNDNPITKILKIMLFAFAFGFLGQLLFSKPAIDTLQQYIVTPTYEKFLNVLSCIASPLIFFSVAWGIYGIGDTATLNRLGKGMIMRYLLDVILGAAFCVLLLPAFECVISGGKVDFTQIVAVYAMILDMLPTSIVEPFVAGNTIQIIMMAVFIGIALLCLGKKTRYVAVAVEQINLITNHLMEAISKLVPLFITLVLINMVWSGTLNTLVSSWRFILVLVIALITVCLIHLVISSIWHQTKIVTLIKKSLPSYLVALTTASSAASFGTLTKNCEKNFGINDSLASFGIPLGIVMHKVASAINCVLIAFYISGIYQIEISLSWIIMAVLISVITAIATPPIPGGAVICYSMLFSQLNLPEEGLAIVLTIDVITDFLITSTDIFCLPLVLARIAKRYGLLDEEKLRN